MLESLGIDCHKELAGAADRHCGVLDIAMLVGNQADHSNGRIGRIVDGVFHAEGGTNDADLDQDDGWLDLGTQNPA